MAVVKKSPFNKTFDALFQFIAEQQVYPALIFDMNESIPKELQGRHFLFSCAAGKDAKKRTVNGIMIAETKGGVHQPFLTAHALAGKKDMRMTVIFQGEEKLSDELVDVLITGVKTYVDGYKDKKEVIKH